MSDVAHQLAAARATAILRTDSHDGARLAMAAAIRGGFQAVEFTLTTPGAMELIRECAANPDVIVGAGTVMDPEQARQSVAAGARFLVSPVMDREVIAEARRLGVCAIPGCHTPTEMWRAHQAGAPLIKLFPAPAGGPAYLRSILGPMPFVRVIPTNGVTLHNAADWLRAGAHAVGFVTELFAAEWLAEGDYQAIEDQARRLLEAVRSPG